MKIPNFRALENHSSDKIKLSLAKTSRDAIVRKGYEGITKPRKYSAWRLVVSAEKDAACETQF